MKIIVVLCFLVACLRVLKKSQKFYRYLKAFESNLPLLSEKKVYTYMAGYFKELVIEIAILLAALCICVIILAWVL